MANATDLEAAHSIIETIRETCRRSFETGPTEPELCACIRGYMIGMSDKDDPSAQGVDVTELKHIRIERWNERTTLRANQALSAAMWSKTPTHAEAVAFIRGYTQAAVSAQISYLSTLLPSS